jgi:hypothetical protein
MLVVLQARGRAVTIVAFFAVPTPGVRLTSVLASNALAQLTGRRDRWRLNPAERSAASRSSPRLWPWPYLPTVNVGLWRVVG